MNATTKQRFISTSIWHDDWFSNLSKDERYFYLYLLSNPQTNAAGVYQNTIKIMSFEVELERADVERMMKKFSEDGKAYYIRDWVIIPKWLKHQKAAERNGILLGALKVLKSLPDDIKAFLLEDRKHYDWDISSIGVPPPKKDSATPLPPPKNKGATPVPPEKTAHDSDLDLNSEFDSDRDIEFDGDSKPTTTPSEKPVDNYRPPPKDLHSFVKEKVKSHGYFIDDPIVKKIIDSVPDIAWLYSKYSIIDFTAGRINEIYSDKLENERKKLFISALTKWDNIKDEYPNWLSNKLKADELRAKKPVKPPDKCTNCGGELKSNSEIYKCDNCGALYDWNGFEWVCEMQNSEPYF
jgi:hypothetical protein